MYVVIVYDVNRKRVGKICKFLKQYLNWIQNSVFEGELTLSQYESIKHNLKAIIKDEDSIIIYHLNKKWNKREILGKERATISNII